MVRASSRLAVIDMTGPRVVDLTRPGASRALCADLGPCTVFVRGVLHVLGPADRRRFAANSADLAGPGGTVLVAETNYAGPLLGYLESLGGGPRGLPGPLARAVAAGLPRPRPFGDAELADCFPPARRRAPPRRFLSSSVDRSAARQRPGPVVHWPTDPLEELVMAKYAVFFSYRPETWDLMMKKPGDRGAAVRDAAAGLGGTLESMYFMFGDRDGFVVVDVPDEQAAAAMALAVGSTGAFAHVETRQLIAPDDLPAVLEKAARAREAYRPPGQ